MNIIGILDLDSNKFIAEKDGEVYLTSWLKDVKPFKDIEEAEQFAKEKLDEESCYDVVKINQETTISKLYTINY